MKWFKHSKCIGSQYCENVCSWNELSWVEEKKTFCHRNHVFCISFFLCKSIRGFCTVVCSMCAVHSFSICIGWQTDEFYCDLSNLLVLVRYRFVVMTFNRNFNALLLMQTEFHFKNILALMWGINLECDIVRYMLYVSQTVFENERRLIWYMHCWAFTWTSNPMHETNKKKFRQRKNLNWQTELCLTNCLILKSMRWA